MEKRKQEDGLSEVSNVLEELKAMSMAMGDEISRFVRHSESIRASLFASKRLF
jgi:hypothetical protein